MRRNRSPSRSNIHTTRFGVQKIKIRIKFRYTITIFYNNDKKNEAYVIYVNRKYIYTYIYVQALAQAVRQNVNNNNNKKGET